MDIILNKVKEQGVVDIIYDYKKDLEFEDILDKYYNDWELISCQRDLPFQFIKDNKENLNMYLFSRFHRMTDEILEEMKDQLNWDAIVASYQLTKPQVEKFSNYINFKELYIKF